ncbi:high mobility group protein hmg-i hmg-y isoform x1 [Limosa lapponica baueri]|uniref:High mobility group protein hmg-i hmg-y isoform x1 n=1 Tax=Limosa lapponica baueri TaxID=1758121 RepID=A0A2I0SZE9_LIMLA|nr:high mobility group protein hmg-i hmg-y isoform x1 [Limosa lapponica baueri]
MSESSTKSSQPLASKGEKDVSEKRGRGRPRKKPQVRGAPREEGGGRSPARPRPPRDPADGRRAVKTRPPRKEG